MRRRVRVKRGAVRLIQVASGVVLAPWATLGWFVASMASTVDDTPAIVHASVTAGLLAALVASTIWLKRNPRA